MSIIYVCVAVRSTLLAEHCILATNTITPAARAILEKIPPTVDRMTYAYREYLFGIFQLTSFSATSFITSSKMVWPTFVWPLLRLTRKWHLLFSTTLGTDSTQCTDKEQKLPLSLKCKTAFWVLYKQPQYAALLQHLRIIREISVLQGIFLLYHQPQVLQVQEWRNLIKSQLFWEK